jgi:hypothetical protein
MKLEKGNFCPLLKKDCVQLQCKWFIQIRGMNPNTGEDVDEYGCAIEWMPILMIENSQQQRQTGAAVESFRNEMIKGNELTTKILLGAMAADDDVKLIK